MTKTLGPRGWTSNQISKRFSNTAPSSYNRDDHTVDCVISMGSPVARFYGTEVLRISPEAVGFERMQNGGMIPLLDSHQSGGIANALGRFKDVWFSRGGLMGTIAFNQTPNGQLAEGMVERGEIAGISAGYCVRTWEISDADGKILDPDDTAIRWEDSLTFTATRWDLHEASLVAVPADHYSGIRTIGNASNSTAEDTRARMGARARMVARMANFGTVR
jgi:Caudovirus prohead serine protease